MIREIIVVHFLHTLLLLLLLLLLLSFSPDTLHAYWQVNTSFGCVCVLL